MPYYSKRRPRFQRRRRISKKYYTKTKKMVTGQPPTLLEKIASGVGTAAKIAGAVLPAIAAINTEHKYYDVTGSASPHSPGTSDSVINLTGGITQGTGDTNRIGNSILAKNISLKIAYNFSGSLGPPPILGLHCRATLICWKDNQTSSPITVNEIFEVPSNLYSPVNKDFSEQFVVIKDKFFALNAMNGIAGEQGFTHMKLFKNLNWHMRWSGAASPSTNHVFMIFRSSASGANVMHVTYYSRLNFTDN